MHMIRLSGRDSFLAGDSFEKFGERMGTSQQRLSNTWAEIEKKRQFQTWIGI